MIENYSRSRGADLETNKFPSLSPLKKNSYIFNTKSHNVLTRERVSSTIAQLESLETKFGVRIGGAIWRSPSAIYTLSANQ